MSSPSAATKKKVADAAPKKAAAAPKPAAKAPAGSVAVQRKKAALAPTPAAGKGVGISARAAPKSAAKLAIMKVLHEHPVRGVSGRTLRDILVSQGVLKTTENAIAALRVCVEHAALQRLHNAIVLCDGTSHSKLTVADLEMASSQNVMRA